MKRNKKKGFTLIELVVVIAIIGILAAVLIPGYNYFMDKARESSAKQEGESYALIYKAAYIEAENDGNETTVPATVALDAVTSEGADKAAVLDPAPTEENTIGFSFSASNGYTVTVKLNTTTFVTTVAVAKA